MTETDLRAWAADPDPLTTAANLRTRDQLLAAVRPVLAELDRLRAAEAARPKATPVPGPGIPADAVFAGLLAAADAQAPAGATVPAPGEG